MFPFLNALAIYDVTLGPNFPTTISVAVLTEVWIEVLAICEEITVVRKETPPTFKPHNAAFSKAFSISSPFQIDVANVTSAEIPIASFATIIPFAASNDKDSIVPA